MECEKKQGQKTENFYGDSDKREVTQERIQKRKSIGTHGLVVTADILSLVREELLLHTLQTNY